MSFRRPKKNRRHPPTNAESLLSRKNRHHHSWGDPIWGFDLGDDHPQVNLLEPKWRQRAYRHRAWKNPAAARLVQLIATAGARLMRMLIGGLIKRPTQ